MRRNYWRLVVLGLGCAVVGALGCVFGDGGGSDDLAIGGLDDGAVVAEGWEGELGAYCTRLRNSSDPFFGTEQRGRLEAELEHPTYPTLSWRTSIMRELARDYLRFGEAEEAIRLLSEALDAEMREMPEVSHEAELLEELAIASLKMGELDNCVSPDGRLICALPLDDSQVHRDKRGAEGAVEYLTRLLELDGDNMRAMWLLNVAHMALGSYAEGLPSGFRIEVEGAESDEGIGRFEEIAPYAGLYSVNTAGGSIVEDFDNDGLLDVMTSTWDPCKPVAYYRNEGDGKFADYTEEAGLGGQLGGLNMTQADYDNDGWVDVLIMRGGWMGERGQMRMSLLRNNGRAGDGKGNTFSDVTEDVGLARPAYPSQSASWGDYDNDGDLDLYSCSETMLEQGLETAQRVFASRLFRNDGGVFRDVGAEAGVQNWRFCKGSAWGDYDNDGDVDLYVSNFGEANRLYRNNGDGTFSDAALELGLTEPVDSFATWFWDYDNDGWLDIFAAGYGTEIEDVAADYAGLANDGARPRLYRNDGAGGFVDVTREAGLYRVHLAMGANFGDLDNDGYLDFYLGTGYPSYDALAPNVMYRNKEGEGFADVTFSGGFGHLQKGHGVSFGDLDRDGDQDIFMQVGGFYPGDGFVNALYKNPGNGNRWLSARLVGVESNRSGVGARVRVRVEEAGGSMRDVHVVVGSGGSFGASTLTQEIGLGQAERIDLVEVHWPASGGRQAFRDVPLDSHIRIREGSDGYDELDLPPVGLGVGRR